MRVLRDEMWARFEPVLPPVKGAMGRPVGDRRAAGDGCDLPVPDRDRLAGPAGRLRAVADGVEAASLARWLRIAERDDGLAATASSPASGAELESEDQECHRPHDLKGSMTR
jgi:hypothetical protein